VRRVLIAGCGYVGSVAADLFQKAGWTVEGWTRTGPAAVETSPEWHLRAIDLSDERQVRSAPGMFDLVIHSASTRGGDVDAYRRVYFEGARHLLERFAGAALLFVSSTSVYAQRTGEWVTEESVAEPEHETGRVLRATENLVLENGGTILRFAGIYGPGRSALLRKFFRGEVAIDPADDRFVNQLHRDDAAAALFRLGGGSPAVGPGIYNVADDVPLRQSECYAWLTERLERPALPSGQTPAPRKRGDSNKRVSNARLRSTEWVPRFPSFMEGMEKSVLPGWDGAHF
jgi:nucleoside-diphosphate-sugar epimerase